jgi:hypothetical protein
MKNEFQKDNTNDGVEGNIERELHINLSAEVL